MPVVHERYIVAREFEWKDKLHTGSILIDVKWSRNTVQARATLNQWPDTAMKKYLTTKSRHRSLITIDFKRDMGEWWLRKFYRRCAHDRRCIALAKKHENEARTMKGFNYNILCVILAEGIAKKYWAKSHPMWLQALSPMPETRAGLERFYASIGFTVTNYKQSKWAGNNFSDDEMEDVVMMRSTIGKLVGICESKQKGRLVGKIDSKTIRTYRFPERVQSQRRRRSKRRRGQS